MGQGREKVKAFLKDELALVDEIEGLIREAFLVDFDGNDEQGREEEFETELEGVAEN